MEAFEELLRKHYAERQLPEARLAEILRVCSVARTTYRWKCIALGSMAVALVSLMTTLWFHLQTQPDTTIVETADPAVFSASPQEAMHQHDLVAVRIHADGCSRSKALEPLFASLQADFMNEPVLFITFDRSSKPATHQTECLSRILGMEDIFQRFRKTGSIIVLDCDGEVREVLDTNCEVGTARKIVRAHLTQH